MLVAAYTRVSTQEQREHGYSLTEQSERLSAYCKAMGWTIYRTYTDGGFSGGNTDRPALQAMIEDIKAGRVQKVVVWKLDRLSRSQLDTLFLIEKVFLANGVDFVSMTENFDTASPFGKAMIGILAVFAQLERERIKERMMVGKAARVKSGKWHGSGVVPIGYDYANGELIVNPYEAMQVREAFSLFLSGMPVKQIEELFWSRGYSHKHGAWNGHAIHRVLVNPVYKGLVCFQGQTYPGQHEPIIDPDTFDRAQERQQALHYSIAPNERVKSLLTGLLFCGQCGARYGLKTKRSKYGEFRYYSCYSRMKVSKSMVRDPNCQNRHWRTDALEQIVFDQISGLAIEPGKLQPVTPEPRASAVKLLEDEAAKVSDQISRLLDLYTVGTIPAEQLAEKADQLTRRKAALDAQIEKERSSSALQPEQALRLAQSFGDVLRSGNREEIRAVIVTLINKIALDGENVTIYWNF